MITEILNGVRVRIYHEGQYVLPLFVCTMCKKESYYFSNKLCDTCCTAQCRTCNKEITGEKKRLFYNKRVANKYHRPFMCLECYKTNF